MQETFISEACIERLHALENAYSSLGSGGTAVASCKGLINEVGVEVLELCAHAQEDLIGESWTRMRGWRVRA